MVAGVGVLALNCALALLSVSAAVNVPHHAQRVFHLATSGHNVEPRHNTLLTTKMHTPYLVTAESTADAKPRLAFLTQCTSFQSHKMSGTVTNSLDCKLLAMPCRATYPRDESRRSNEENRNQDLRSNK
jgi:hypothetical protein